MADVVNQGERLGEIGVEAESGGDGPGDLRDLQGMRQAVAKMIGEASSENLRFGFEPAEELANGSRDRGHA